MNRLSRSSATAGLSRRTFLGVGATVTAGTLVNLNGLAAEAPQRRVVVWSEGTAPKDVYPKDINGAIAEGLKTLRGWDVVTASINDPDQGVSEESLKQTNVLIWWGHKRHDEVKDDLVERIVKRVKEDGMGFIAVHSSHFAKPYRRLMGTECSWKDYQADGSSVKVIVKDSNHPIARRVQDFELAQTERYTEPFKVPEPEAVVFDGLYKLPDGSTESSRQGLVWTIGKGRVFYFQPGHETYPHMLDKNVQQIMRNAVRWAAPRGGA
jgi:trehalose utilization protein